MAESIYNLLSRKEAKELGSKYYFTSNPCKRGHIVQRFTCSSNCIECYQYGTSEKEYKAQYYINNKEQLKTAQFNRIKNNPNYHTEKNRRWRNNHPHKAREYSEAYYGYIKIAKPTWANDALIKEKYIERDNLNKETGIVHHVDHIIPLQGENVCGLHVEYNLQVLTANDNMTKSNTFIDIQK